MRARFLIVAVVALLALSGCDWTQFRFLANHSGHTPDAGIDAGNVSTVILGWTAMTGGPVESSPAVANGVAFVGSNDGKLYAFDAGGTTNCSGEPKTCDPLWTAPTGGPVRSSPAVTADGVVFVGSDDGKLYAFDAAGTTNCSGVPKTCDPLWTAATGASIESSPSAPGKGTVFVGSDNGKLYAFDASGSTNCSGVPKTCAPLWTAATGGPVDSSPAVAFADGTVYVGSDDGKLYAFDAAGATNCAGTPKTCDPLWTAATGGPVNSSPAIANPTSAVPGGIVYVGSEDDELYAFSATGTINCSGIPKTCGPVGSATTGGDVSSSPAVVAKDVLYVGAGDGKLYAFDPRGTTNCSVGIPATCSPLWSATAGAPISSSPAVANGVVYVGSADHKLYAFAPPTPIFSPPAFYGPDSSIELALGDFNRDGETDVVVTHFSDHVSILTGNGDGTFVFAASYGIVGPNSYFVATGDFDNDADDDLAVTHASGGVSVLLNNGDGTFAAAVEYPGGIGGAVGVVAGDLDGDTDVDLAVSDGNSNVSVLRNNGDATFAFSANYPVGDFPAGLSAGDLDGDADPDLAVPNGSSNTVSVLRNNGDGTFAAAADYGVGTRPWKVAIGDLDSDADADLAVTNTDSNNVSILLNNGNGTFAAAAEYGVGGGPVGIAVGEFTGGTASDLAVGNLSSNNVSVLFNEGDGTFSGLTNTDVDVTFGIAVHDFNHDAKPDVVANGTTAMIAVLLQL
jgi:outer membrane protein assembly factor BamB